MIKWVRRYYFRKQVKIWCLDIRLHRELVKKIRELQKEALHTDNQLMARFIGLQLDLFMPDYRRLDDMLRNEMIKRLRSQLIISREKMHLAQSEKPQ